jgi:hypothetical protein
MLLLSITRPFTGSIDQGYKVRDISRNILKGNFIEAGHAAFEVCPFETVTFTATVFVPPSVLIYTCYFVPWRHSR